MKPLALIVLLLAAPASAKVVVSDAFIRPAPAGAPATGAYLTLRNEGSGAVTLTGIHCVCAAEVSAHETVTDGGVMHMRAAPSVVIPANGAVAFRPGGLHLMVMGLNRPLKPGQRVPIRLTFEGAPAETVRFEVKR